jgi:carotenoid cleavage dioxygenase-like enzyme
MTDELGTVGSCDFGGTLPGGFAAHTKLDHATGELHAIAYFWAWDHVQHVIVGADGKVTRTTDIPVPDGPMMHDFALTAKYVVLLDLPVTFSLNAVTAGKELPYVWNDKHQARVGLLPRDGSSGVRWIGIEPCWVFHARAITWPRASARSASANARRPHDLSHCGESVCTSCRLR